MILAFVLAGCMETTSHEPASIRPAADGRFHVYPGDDVQSVLNAAAASDMKQVIIHEGAYRAPARRQAFIWLNAAHDGIHLTGEGSVVLHADNPEVSSATQPGYPAVVNHILYFGDGITSATRVSGLRLTGANAFVTESEETEIQPELASPRLKKTRFFYSDGGGIKVFGRSSPVIEQLDIVDNYASPCGGGVSIEHLGFSDNPVVFRDCIFRNNRCRITGSGVDVLPGSSAQFFNCLFIGNIANLGTDDVSDEGFEYNKTHGCGALTVFPDSAVHAERCTFAFNWNGVDDKSRRNIYRDSIFWKNTAVGGVSPGERYELDILSAVNVRGCFIHGQINDLRESISSEQNTLNAVDPEFDSQFVPRATEYANAGYRPTGRWTLPADSFSAEADRSLIP